MEVFYIDSNDIRYKVDPGSTENGVGRWCANNVSKRAWEAAWDLECMGLVEVFTVRCCPGKSCNENNRHEVRLTETARNAPSF